MKIRTVFTILLLSLFGMSAGAQTVGNSNVILPWGSDEQWQMKYFFKDHIDDVPPPEDSEGNPWYAVDYDDAEWGTLIGPMGSEVNDFSGNKGYDWNIEYSSFYLRRSFVLSEISDDYYYFEVFVDDNAIVYINGVEVLEGYLDDRDSNRAIIPKNLLKIGENTLAVYIDDGGGVDCCFDYTLFTSKTLMPRYFFTDDQGVSYELKEESGTYKVIGHDDFNVNLIIPATLFGCPVTEIDDSALGWGEMETVILPEGLETIGLNSISDCKLSSIIIPASVTSMYPGEDNTISNNPFLESIQVAEGNKVYDSRGNCNAVIETATNKLISGCNTTVIPSSVTSIGNDAFYGCAFTTITIPESVTSIGYIAFDNCFNLTEITIPRNVTNIGNDAFVDCSVLDKVTVEFSQPIAIDESVFPDRARQHLYVPVGSKTAFLNASVWQEFGSILEIDEVEVFDSKPYAHLSTDNTTLTFYYDNKRGTRQGTTFDLNEGRTLPDWYNDPNRENITNVVFDPSFANARPTSTYVWFGSFINLLEIEGLEYLNTEEVTIMEDMFSSCPNITNIDVSHFNTSKVTNMVAMFNGCQQLQSIDVSHFDTSKVTDMTYMFHMCWGLTSLDVTNFDTSNVRSMNYMFADCQNLLSIDVTHFDTSNVISMDCLFEQLYSIQSIDLSSFDTSKTTSFGRMFYNCYKLRYLKLSSSMTNVSGGDVCFNIGSVDYPCVVDVPEGFDFGVDTSGNYFLWNDGYFKLLGSEVVQKEPYVLRSTDGTTLTFYYDNKRGTRQGTTFDLNEGSNYPSWITDAIDNTVITSVVFDQSFADARPTSTCRWFYGLSNVRAIEGLEYLNTSEVSVMTEMFSYSGLIELDLSLFDTSKVTRMYGMFRSCSSLKNLNLSSFNTSNVTNMSYMFYSCVNLINLNLSSFNTSNVTNMRNMFYNCKKLTELNLSSFNTSKVTNMSFMFEACSKLTTIDLSSFDTSSVTTMSSIFSRCSNLTHLDLNSFSADNVTSMGAMFSNCTALSSIDLSGFGISKVINVSMMFNNCSSLTNLDLGHFDTSNVQNFQGMFQGCTSLTSLDVSFFDTSSATDMGWMFWGCSSLKTIDISNFDTSKVTSFSSFFDRCYNLKTVDLSHLNTSSATTMHCMFEDCHSLTNVDLSTFDTSKVTDTFHMFSCCNSLTSIDLSMLDLSQVAVSDSMFAACTSLRQLAVAPAMANFAGNATMEVGTAGAPCALIAPEGFDFGGIDTSGDSFVWKSGYFKLCTISNLAQYDNVIYIENNTVKSGKQATMQVKMNNTIGVRGFQFDIVLPEGVTIATDEDGLPLVSLSYERTTKNKMSFFDANIQADGTVRVLCNSSGGYTFDGTSGEVCTFVVNVAEDLAAGSYPMTLRDIILTDVDANRYAVDDDITTCLTVEPVAEGDANGDGIIDVADIALVANYILGRTANGLKLNAADVNSDGYIDIADIAGIANIILHGKASAPARVRLSVTRHDVSMGFMPLTISAGSTAEMIVTLSNPLENVASWQADLTLPEGLAIVDIRPAVERRTDQTFDWEPMDNGTNRVLCVSMRNRPFNGNEGAVAIVTLRAENDIMPGIYDVALGNAILTGGSNRLETPEATSFITVAAPTGINFTVDDQVRDSEYFTTGGARLSQPQRGITIVRDANGQVRKQSRK